MCEPQRVSVQLYEFEGDAVHPLIELAVIWLGGRLNQSLGQHDVSVGLEACCLCCFHQPWATVGSVHPERLSSSAGGTAIYSLVTVVHRRQVENPLSHFSLQSYCSWASCCLPPQNPLLQLMVVRWQSSVSTFSPSLSAEVLMNHELTQKPEEYEVEEKMSGIQLPQRATPSILTLEFSSNINAFLSWLGQDSHPCVWTLKRRGTESLLPSRTEPAVHSVKKEKRAWSVLDDKQTWAF